MAREVVVLAEERGRGERGGADEEEGRGEPEDDACAEERVPALPAAAERGGHEHASDRRVGERHVDRRRPDPQRCARLVRRVEEEERDGGCEDERLRRRVTRQRPHDPGRRGRPGERLGRSPGGL